MNVVVAREREREGDGRRCSAWDGEHVGACCRAGLQLRRPSPAPLHSNLIIYTLRNRTSLMLSYAQLLSNIVLCTHMHYWCHLSLSLSSHHYLYINYFATTPCSVTGDQVTGAPESSALFLPPPHTSPRLRSSLLHSIPSSSSLSLLSPHTLSSSLRLARLATSSYCHLLVSRNCPAVPIK
jgi:hypothetical protein